MLSLALDMSSSPDRVKSESSSDNKRKIEEDINTEFKRRARAISTKWGTKEDRKVIQEVINKELLDAGVVLISPLEEKLYLDIDDETFIYIPHTLSSLFSHLSCLPKRAEALFHIFNIQIWSRP